MESRCISALLFAFLIISSFPSTFAGLQDPYPNSANLFTSWTNTPGGECTNNLDSVNVKPILLSLRETSGPGFLCGFFCQYASNSCPFAILIFQDVYSPQPVWSANQNRPVGFNATVRLTEEGDLILADADGTFVWSTNTAGKPTLAAPQLHPFPANYLNIIVFLSFKTRATSLFKWTFSLQMWRFASRPV